MSGKRVFTKMVGKGEKQPAVRVGFTGKHQIDYFALRKVAEEDFKVKQTTLCRMILCDWMKSYREKRVKGVMPARRMSMILGGGKKPASKERVK